MNLRKIRIGRTTRWTASAVAIVLGAGLVVPAMATPAAAAGTYCGYTVTDQIEVKYRALASDWNNPSASRLGCPRSAQATTSQDKTVVYQRFAGGSIYYSPSTGAYAVYTSMLDSWNLAGGLRGPFKQPIRDESPSPIGVGVYQQFKGGIIYSRDGFACAVETTVLGAGTPERGFAEQVGKSNCGGSWAYVTALIVNNRYKTTPFTNIKFCSDGCGVAGSGGYTVTINAKYVHDKPNDFGLVTHELTHLAQGYQGITDGWTTETIADWTRFVLGQPITPGKPATCDAGDRYNTLKSQCGVTLLNYIDDQVAAPFVQDLNVYLHNSGSSSNVDSFVRSSTGRSLQQLWDACRAPGKPCAGGRA